MQIERVHEGIRYTLSNEGIQTGDEVFPIANGRCLDGGGWILHDFDFQDFVSGFPNEPHIIETLKHSDYKPYEVRTDHGYGPIEIYYKIVRVERKVKVRESIFGGSYEWQEFDKKELRHEEENI